MSHAPDPQHTLDDAPAGSGDGLNAVAERYGMTPNIYAQMAHAPVVINGLGALGRAIEEHSALDRKAREIIALAMAAANHCDYCQAAHTMAGEAAGLTKVETVRIRRGDVEEPKLRSLASVAREAAEHTGAVSDDMWQAAIGAGWSVTDLTDAFAAIALNSHHLLHPLRRNRAGSPRRAATRVRQRHGPATRRSIRTSHRADR